MPQEFDTGAYRDGQDGKYDYEGFLSPLVLERFARYMHENRRQSNGELRDSDNWQLGVPLDSYMKSGFRHFMDWWGLHRGKVIRTLDIEEALCGVLFNAMGYLHEHMKQEAERKMHLDDIVADEIVFPDNWKD